MTSTTNIIAKFEAAFKAFETTDERPIDFYVTQIYDAIANIFYPIRYNRVGSRQNLMGLIYKNDAYATEYGKLFPRPEHPGIYASDLKAQSKCS